MAALAHPYNPRETPRPLHPAGAHRRSQLPDLLRHLIPISHSFSECLMLQPLVNQVKYTTRPRTDSSVVERLVYTELVGGSNPSPCTTSSPIDSDLGV